MVHTLTPNDIEFLIHCHVSPDPHPRRFALAVQATITMFLVEGLIELVLYPDSPPDTYKTTERGQALMTLLCCTPFPTQRWVDSTGKVINCD